MLTNRTRKNISDEDLVAKYRKSGKKKLVGELWNRYAHLVFGVCLKYLKNQESAQDATIVVFESLFDKLKTNKVESFKSWIYVVSKNQCLMILRKDKKWKEKTLGEQALKNVRDEESFSDLNEEHFQHLEKAIETLNEEQKICIELFYLKDKSYKDVASLTGFDIQKVKSHIQNGKRNLKNQLSKKDEHES